MSEPICMRKGCGKPAKILSARIKAGAKYCNLSCAAIVALEASMDYKWCKIHNAWESESEQKECLRMQLRVPNRETIEAMKEADREEGTKYDSPEEMFSKLEILSLEDLTEVLGPPDQVFATDGTYLWESKSEEDYLKISKLDNDQLSVSSFDLNGVPKYDIEYQT